MNFFLEWLSEYPTVAGLASAIAAACYSCAVLAWRTIFKGDHW
jgi:hypothetical protein